MTKKYLVKLTPHDRFFFGGETTFGEGDIKNYFVKSNHYPQQTSLLGLIRYQLLLKNGLMKNDKIADKAKAETLIGKESFKLDNGFNFEAIKSLSPVFITDGNLHLFPANREYQWYFDKETKAEVKEMRQISFHINGKCSLYDKIPELLKYDAKEELPDLLVDKNKKLYRYSQVFKEYKQVGIRKDYKGKTQDDAYYIQIFYKIMKGYSFASIVELDDNFIFDQKEIRVNFSSEAIVFLGAEQSKFRMDVTETKKDFDQLLPDYEKSDNSAKVVLVSDAYLPTNDILNESDFAITDIVDFRSLETSVNDTENYSAFDRKKIKTNVVWKSGKYNFFKKGSVFFGDTNTISKKLNNDDLQKIGYNIYKPIIKKS
ncbi:MAG: hypothetical protein IPH11_15540 [Ignavibacteriales bacterium]|nr:hypothetical protein [Ignavibacteriales bacterium]